MSLSTQTILAMHDIVACNRWGFYLQSMPKRGQQSMTRYRLMDDKNQLTVIRATTTQNAIKQANDYLSSNWRRIIRTKPYWYTARDKVNYIYAVAS